jgi:hypothetical protein
MHSFTSIAALLAVTGSAQTSESLRSSRSLSFQSIAGYEPGTMVTDQVSSPQIDATISITVLKSNSSL